MPALPTRRAEETFPDAEIIPLGVEEPRCLVHAAAESLDPSEIEQIALAKTLFLHEYPNAKAT